MGAYLTLLLILAAWALVVLRDGGPLRPYAIIYGVNTVLASATEWLIAIVLDCYTFGGYPNYFLVTLGIEPLLGVLYTRYSSHRPIHRALLWALILGGPMELVYLWAGAYRYDRGWHPVLTMICFFAYFLWTLWLKNQVDSKPISSLR